MKSHNLLFVLFLTYIPVLFSKSGNEVQLAQQHATYLFIENKGQVTDQFKKSRPDVLFSGTAGPLVFHLRNNGISYQLNKVEEWKESPESPIKGKIPSKGGNYRIDINWLNASKTPFVIKGNESADYSNYYLSHCPGGILNVRSYSSLTYKNIYSNIDLKWYEKNGNLKYDFIVLPGGNCDQVKLEINGAEKIRIDRNGELEITTPSGIITEKAPLAYQGNKNIKTSWSLTNNIACFTVSGYDKNLPLIIDPAVRVWASYYGGSLIDYAFGLTADASGNVFMGGFTQSNAGTAMATSGSYQSAYGGGTNDAFLVKFNSAGVRQWGTYFGGSALDVISGCCTDASGNVFVSGYTDSGNAISTPGSHQQTFGGSVDGFLAKFDTNGALQWGTYYGGALNDYGYGCATDATGNVFLCGHTSSTGGTDIATPSGSQPTHGGSTWDGFIAKFNTNGVRQWGTYYGGASNEYIFNCCTDNSGNSILIGKTASTNSAAISTPGCHQNFNGGNYDAFVAKFDPSGSRLWGTFYGGFGDEIGYSGATDVAGNIFLSGETDSNTGTSIATAGSHQSAIGGGFGDAFLVKFNSSGTRQWGTYYGGANYEEGASCSTDPWGNVFLCGQTSSQTGTIMATAGTHQSSYAGGNYDAYLAKFDPGGVRQWSTYYGEINDDYGVVCRADAGNNIYMTGKTSSGSGTGIATGGSHQSAYGGGSFDGFIVKFFECPDVSIDITLLSNVSCNGGNDGAATISAGGGSGFTYTWAPVGITTQTVTGLSAGTYSCIVSNSCGAVSSQSFSITQPAVMGVNAVSNNSLICIGSTCTLNAFATGGSGAYTYSWSSGAATASAVISPSVNTAYTVSVVDVNNCWASDTITQNVISCVGINENTRSRNALNVFPNPGNGIYFIKGTLFEFSVLVYNSLGQLVSKQTIDERDPEIDISEHPRGIYYMQFLEKERMFFSATVIKE